VGENHQEGKVKYKGRPLRLTASRIAGPRKNRNLHGGGEFNGVQCKEGKRRADVARTITTVTPWQGGLLMGKSRES